MSLYSYAKSKKFQNGINLKNLKSEIENNGNINKNIINIFYTSETVNIKFDTDLSSEEQNILENTIIPNHDYNETVNVSSTYNIITPYIENSSITTKNYIVSASFIYDGSVFNNIVKIGLLTEMQNNNNLNSSYDIKIYDQTNNQLIKEINNLTNNKKQIINITNLSNIPSNEAIIEIYVKTTNHTVKVYYINVFFE